MANCIGRIVKGCESCAQISMVRRLKHSYRRVRATRIASTRRNGVSESQLIQVAGKSTGHKKVLTSGKGRIFRANTEIPNGQSPANRTDVEVIFEGLPEPIDLELDVYNRVLYWTDRGDPPRGNTVNRASIDAETEDESGDSGHPFDGGNRYRSRFQGESNVRD